MLKLIEKNLIYLFVLVYSNGLFAAHPSAQKKVVFIAPSDQTSLFFLQTAEIMQTAADDLNLDFEVVYGDDLVIASEEANAVLERKELPDYLILTNLRGVTERLMIKADKLGVKTLIFNAGLSDSSARNFRHGFAPLQHWIGQVLPDDVQAGSLTAQKLVEAARNTGKFDEKNKIQLIGINGSLRAPASLKREQGLMEYVSEQPDVQLNIVVNTEWNTAEARKKTFLLLNRFRDISVIWTAADVLALGASEAAIQYGLNPGKNIFTAGTDWLPKIFPYISDKSVTGSTGGHAFDGAWALVVIYDHIHGFTDDFVNERTYYDWIDADSLSSVQALMDPLAWQNIDFLQYTKKHSQKETYKFSVKSLLEK